MPPPTPSLTAVLNRCIQHAFSLARDARHEYLTLEHLLLALQDDPSVVAAVAACGGDSSRLRRELEGFFAEYDSFRFDPYRGLATGYVVDTMQTVLYHFFRGADFEECLVGTINQGGDADTTGAIVGALAGAYYDLESIPKRWLKKMNQNVIAEADRLARQLIDLSPYALSRLPSPPCKQS